MKRLWPIFSFMLLLASCSPQKQLVRLLERHPELRQDSIVTFHDTIVIEPAAAEIAFTLDDLISVAQQPDTVNADSAATPAGITVSAGGAVATLYPKDGHFMLHAEQRIDTIYIEHVKKVPAYYTKTITKQVEVPKPYNKFIKFLIGSGGFFWLLIITLIVLGIIKAVR